MTDSQSQPQKWCYRKLINIGDEGIRLKPRPAIDSHGDGYVFHNGNYVSHLFPTKLHIESIESRKSYYVHVVAAAGGRSQGYINAMYLDRRIEFKPPAPLPKYDPPLPSEEYHLPPIKVGDMIIKDKVDPLTFYNLHYDIDRKLYYVQQQYDNGVSNSYWASTTPDVIPVVYHNVDDNRYYVAVPDNAVPDGVEYYQLFKNTRNGGLRRRKFRSHKKRHVKSRPRSNKSRSKKSCSRRH
jgi:hypothetical protein